MGARNRESPPLKSKPAVSSTPTGKYVNVGLPWGPKPRLILAHLNAEALRLGSPEIAIETASRASSNASEASTAGAKYECSRTAHTSLQRADPARHASRRARHPDQTHVVTGFELWLPKDERQRVLWPSIVHLSKSISKVFKGTPYPSTKPISAAWRTPLWASTFTPGWRSACTASTPGSPPLSLGRPSRSSLAPTIGRCAILSAFFRRTLAQVQSRYQTARIELDDKGMTARNSPPPVGKRLILISKPSSKKPVIDQQFPAINHGHLVAALQAVSRSKSIKKSKLIHGHLVALPRSLGRADPKIKRGQLRPTNL